MQRATFAVTDAIGRRPYLLLLGVLGIYFVLSVFLHYHWVATGVAPIIGDEPHYLVMTHGIVADHTLEQTVPYREAFERQLFFPWPSPTPETIQVVSGPHGLFNVHNFGLPVLLALPYLIHGAGAVKLFMILIGGLGIFVLWRISGVFTATAWVRAVALSSVAIAMPLLSGTNQIYPDIPAGVLALIGLYWLLTVSKPRRLWREIVMASAVAYLPFLQIKFGAAAAVLVLALAISLYLRTRRIRTALIAVVPLAVAGVIQVAYNLYAFGNASGPYSDGALEVSPHSLMVFFGLNIDQNQGIVFQNPLALIGIFSIGLMFAARRWFSLVVLVTFLALVVPNSLHVNWYGGSSFVGRFAWAGALVFMIFTLYGMIRLSTVSRRWFVAVASAGLLIQAVFYGLYTFTTVQLYNRDPSAWLLNYTDFFFPLQDWLPALYDIDWAYRYAPNYVWVAILFAALIGGFLVAHRRRRPSQRSVIATLLVAAVAVAAAGFVVKPVQPEMEFPSSTLATQVGTVTPTGIEASTSLHSKTGILAYGPYVLLRTADYRLTYVYSSSAPTDTVVGSWQPDEFQTAKIMDAMPLYGTDGEVKTLTIDLDLKNRLPRGLEIQTIWNGSADLTFISLAVASAS